MTTDECVVLSDDELLDQTYEALAKVAELDENLAGHLASLVGEWSERFAPEAARAELIRLHEGLDALGLASDALAEDELGSDLDALRRREAVRLVERQVDGRDPGLECSGEDGARSSR